MEIKTNINKRDLIKQNILHIKRNHKQNEKKKKTTYRRNHLQVLHPTKDQFPKYKNRPYSSIAKQKGRRSNLDIAPKETYRWPKDT